MKTYKSAARFLNGGPSTAPLSLRGNFAWTFVGNIVFAATQWLTLISIVKLGTPNMVGRFAIAIAICTPIFVFTNLALRTVIATDAKNLNSFGDYYSLRLISSAVALIMILAIVLAFGYQPEKALTILVFAIARAAESISDVIYGLFQRNERMDRISISMSIRGVTSVSFFSLTLWFTHSLLWATVGLALAWIFVLLTFDVCNCVAILNQSNSTECSLTTKLRPARELIPKIDIPVLRDLLLLTLPLGIAMVFGSLYQNVPRYFLERMYGEYELGIFAALASLMVAGTTVVRALAITSSARLAKYHAARESRKFSRLLSRLIALGIFLGIFGVLISLMWGQRIVNILFTSEYAVYNNILVWLMLVATLQYVSSFLGLASTAGRYFRIQPVILMLSLCATVVACFFLIPHMGLAGAAQGMVVGSLVQLTGFGLVTVFSLYKLNYNLHRQSEGSINAEI